VSGGRERTTGSPTAAYLRGRHAIVTGGGRGIGAAIARELAQLGARLTLMGRDALALERHAKTLDAEFGAEATAVPCDVSDAAEIADAFSAARSEFGDAHVLVNNAGQAESHPFAGTSPEVWHRLIAVNLTGTFLCTQQVLPAMLAGGEGRIVNIASTAGLRGYARMGAYCAAKHGVIGLTRSLALETAKKGITVNAVCPGYTDTDMAQQAVHNLVAARGVTADEAMAMILKVSPRGKLVSPAEVANTVGWLCSPEASAITGQAIAVAGGEVM
jgi:NAD(P)-dependent dehydrogenase (short-subunit alcohol dehydrogenase family)